MTPATWAVPDHSYRRRSTLAGHGASCAPCMPTAGLDAPQVAHALLVWCKHKKMRKCLWESLQVTAVVLVLSGDLQVHFAVLYGNCTCNVCRSYQADSAKVVSSEKLYLK